MVIAARCGSQINAGRTRHNAEEEFTRSHLKYEIPEEKPWESTCHPNVRIPEETPPPAGEESPLTAKESPRKNAN